MADLPFVDRHGVEIAAAPPRVWRALEELWGPAPPGRGQRLVATVLGLEDRGDDGPLGFHVASAEAPHLLRLEGRHRFSTYALEFRAEARPGGRTWLWAETRAAFPGPAGAVYRALVIGSRGHVLAVRRMLGRVRSRAVR